MSPVEILISKLLDGYSYDQAIEAAGFTKKEANTYLEKHQPALYAALQRGTKQAPIKPPPLKVTKVTNKGQLLTDRPSWYTGQSNNKHVPLAHVVLLPTIKVIDGVGHLTQLPRGYVIIHKDWNKENVALDNLAMVTKSEATKLCNQRRYELSCESA